MNQNFLDGDIIACLFMDPFINNTKSTFPQLFNNLITVQSANSMILLRFPHWRLGNNLRLERSWDSLMVVCRWLICLYLILMMLMLLLLIICWGDYFIASLGLALARHRVRCLLVAAIAAAIHRGWSILCTTVGFW